MTIVLVNASAPQTYSTQNVSVNMPSGLVVGNLLVVLLRHSTVSSATTGPAGWTALAGLNTSNNTALWYRRVDGTETASYTFSAASLNTISDAIALQYSGVIPSGSPFDQAATGRDTLGTNATSTALSLTTGVANALVVYADAKNANSRTLSSAPTSMTDRTGPTTTFHVFDMQQAVAGATGSKSAVMTAASVHYDVMFSLKPAPSAAFLSLL